MNMMYSIVCSPNNAMNDVQVKDSTVGGSAEFGHENAVIRSMPSIKMHERSGWKMQATLPFLEARV